MTLVMSDKASREAVKNELKQDFEKCLDKLDFANYDPASTTFMHPLSIGLMWHLIHEMEKSEMPMQTAMR